MQQTENKPSFNDKIHQLEHLELERTQQLLPNPIPSEYKLDFYIKNLIIDILEI